ncbi:hypothetical protein PRIPAC_97332 [Pristionchus pacificus]|uniref:Uncharacterized protein n=1 Tax=Pristionchus pacificus TaxID=54126 RepID=A0A2A6BBV4_PRIPA|nr:hypothetical protein PRIPAC_97332 [Pristionchus pacificus]|eukprot:PDM63363.1 hypothetical protein PRIPAC_53720 [Pristionchus pacificus]
MPNAMQNEGFINWMIPAYATTFRKLWMKFVLDHQPKDSPFKNGLPNGTYFISIENNWNLDRTSENETYFELNGRTVFKKRIVFSTVNWTGGKNNFLGYAYLIVGVIILFIGCGLAIMQSFRPTYIRREVEEHIRWRKDS